MHIYNENIQPPETNAQCLGWGPSLLGAKFVRGRDIPELSRSNKPFQTLVVVMGTPGIKDPYTAASLYELGFTATRSVSDQCCEVQQCRVWLVAGWVTQTLEQG